MSKPKVLKSLEKLDPEILKQIINEHPYGFDKKLLTIPHPNPGKKGKLITVMPYEAEDLSYLVIITLKEAQALYVKVEEEDDGIPANMRINLADIIELEDAEKKPKRRGRPPKKVSEEEEMA
jgi:hypothetical protein